jgi:hypothetical protein
MFVGLKTYIPMYLPRTYLPTYVGRKIGPILLPR